jgi:hypothetical protein
MRKESAMVAAKSRKDVRNPQCNPSIVPSGMPTICPTAMPLMIHPFAQPRRSYGK